jgi:hypothetical protein
MASSVVSCYCYLCDSVDTPHPKLHVIAVEPSLVRSLYNPLSQRAAVASRACVYWQSLPASSLGDNMRGLQSQPVAGA